MPGLLADRVALVTGAGSGIGAAAAVEFAKNGASVVVADLDEVGGHKTVQKIVQNGGRSHFIRTDVTQDVQVGSLIDESLREFGGLDCAFNNAGIIGDVAPIETYSRATWDQVMAVNLTGVWACMQHEIRYMKEHGGGSIVNTASIAGMRGSVGAYAYSISKWGVIGMTKSAAKACGAMNIRVNAVCPGFTSTPMLSTRFSGDFSKLADQSVLGRIAEPTEIAEAVVWLSSDAARFITGVALPVDGGVTA